MAGIPYQQAKTILEKEVAQYNNGSINITQNGSRVMVRYELDVSTDLYALVHLLTNTLGDMKVSTGAQYPGSLFLQYDGMIIFLQAQKKTLVFGKIGDLLFPEISAILETYKISHPKQTASGLEQLVNYGAVIHRPAEGLDWDSFAGYDGVKQQIKEHILLPLKESDIYQQLIQGTRKYYESPRPKAVLFEGPAGTGKTTMARIIAKDINIPLVYIPLETIMSKWYGESENKLADIFRICRTRECLLFFDEIDALAISRDDSIHEVTRRVLSVLLREIDGFVPNDKTLVLAASNRKNDLDEALLSRFGCVIRFPLPNHEERIAIFATYAKHLPQSALDILAQKTDGCSGRTIKDICASAECAWAAKLLEKKKQFALPSCEEYLAVLETKQIGESIRKYIL